jgi:hypothetical protein
MVEELFDVPQALRWMVFAQCGNVVIPGGAGFLGAPLR